MIHNTPISFVKALVTKFLSLNSNEEVSKIQIVRKRYIGSKQNILSTGKSNIALHIKKKGHLNLILHQLCYLLPENFHLSNTMPRPNEDKKFLNKSFITVEHITLLQ